VTERACAGLLLTGGASRRFGTPKGEFLVLGERLADRTARALATVADPALEVGPGYSSLEVVVEPQPGSGPLAGIAAGRTALLARGFADTPALVLAVDLPFLEVGILGALIAARPADAVVPRVDGVPQPLCARYSGACLARAVELVNSGERSMRALLHAVDVRWLDEEDWSAVTSARSFADIDTPEDAQRLGL
jgi:molybdopterin-guanine dinucleotide biosynthesis protein A